jgi:hypothetical protein
VGRVRGALGLRRLTWDPRLSHAHLLVRPTWYIMPSIWQNRSGGGLRSVASMYAIHCHKEQNGMQRLQVSCRPLTLEVRWCREVFFTTAQVGL